MPSELPRLVTRVSKDIYNKFCRISDRENRTVSNMLSSVVIKFINDFENKNGELIVNDEVIYNKKLANAINDAIIKMKITDEVINDDTNTTKKAISLLRNGYLPDFAQAVTIMQYLNFNIDNIIEFTNKSEDYVRLFIAQNYVIELRDQLITTYNDLLDIYNNQSEQSSTKVKEMLNTLNYFLNNRWSDLNLITGKEIALQISSDFTGKYMDE